MSKVFVVMGVSCGSTDGAIFGVYPTKALATSRLKIMTKLYKEGEDGFEDMWISAFDMGDKGTDKIERWG